LCVREGRCGNRGGRKLRKVRCDPKNGTGPGREGEMNSVKCRD
jgi:hypothetical protein